MIMPNFWNLLAQKLNYLIGINLELDWIQKVIIIIILLNNFLKYKYDLNNINSNKKIIGRTTGEHSVYTTHKGYEIMFHVANYLPFNNFDPQQVERKRHLGNDVIIIVFKEGEPQFDPIEIKSQFNRLFF